MTNHKLHIVEDQSSPQQPTFPATNVQILAQGLAITTALAPGLTIGQMIDAATMDRFVMAGLSLAARSNVNRTWLRK